jgi:hypothetical protein
MDAPRAWKWIQKGKALEQGMETDACLRHRVLMVVLDSDRLGAELAIGSELDSLAAKYGLLRHPGRPAEPLNENPRRV